jgi:hypothetical protein
MRILFILFFCGGFVKWMLRARGETAKTTEWERRRRRKIKKK